MTTLTQTKRNSIITNADEFNSYTEGVNAAHQFFIDCEIEGTVNTHKIFTEEKHIGDTHEKTTYYESYVDSGSVDYYYFAVVEQLD